MYVLPKLKAGAKTDIFTAMFITNIHNSQKVTTTHISIIKWMDKANVHIYNKIWFGLKRNGILIHATTWTNLGNIMQFEISWIFKNIVLFYLYKVHSLGRFRAESLMRLPEAGGRWKWEVSVSWVQNKVMKIDSGDGCKTLWMYLIPGNCMLEILKMVNFLFVYFNSVKKKKKSLEF